jgi:tRNA U34 2-thiouridine synthase MnmA/TrmU
MRKIKALLLFSGGLDSILATKVLMEQGIKVKGITFKSYFFDAEQAKKAAKKIKLPLKVIDFSREHLKIVKNPKHGYGKAINPCIDCHILMLKKAKEIMKKEKLSFVATGEVLGERPMSQNKRALGLIEKECGLKGYLLRPLSARLLETTIPERMGWVDREKLLDIFGRSRKRQIALAKKYKITKYPLPAGGCLLCDIEFSKRLRELLKIYPRCNGSDIELLKLGRHFWFDKTKIVVGRNEEENKKIKKLKKKRDILIEMKNYPGPLTLVRDYNASMLRSIEQDILEKAKKLTQYYSTKARRKKNIEFKIKIC